MTSTVASKHRFVNKMHMFFISPNPGISFAHRKHSKAAISRRQKVQQRKSISALGPVLAPDTSYGEGSVSSPIVHRYEWDEGSQYVMWYTVRPQKWDRVPEVPPGTLTGDIRLALSSNGLAWRRVSGPHSGGAVLAPNDEQWWAFDTGHLTGGSVVLSSPARVRADSGVYLLYYTGGDTERVPLNDVLVPGLRMRIGVALSKDGENFTRIEGEFPSGAALDVSTTPAFDDLFIASPNVLHCPSAPPDQRYIMFYHGFSSNDYQFAIGRAISPDAFAFTRSPLKNPVVTAEHAPPGTTWAAGGVCRPSVLRRTNDWIMFAEVIGKDGVHRIASCISTDGFRWSNLDLALDTGAEGEWDSAGVSHPYPVRISNGVLRLYYTGKSGKHDVDAGLGTCIGVAESNNPEWRSFSKIEETIEIN